MVEENETANLMAQYEKLKADCFGFDNELAQLNQGFMQKLDKIKQLQKELIELRSQYNKKIDAGDGKGADKILDNIKTGRQKLKTLISEMLKEGQFDELKVRAEGFNKDTQQLYQRTKDNWQMSLELMNRCSALASSILPSFNHNFAEIEQIISEAKKLNDKVFGG